MPELLVCTRFGLWVRNREWLQHRLALLSSITAPSLLAQSDQGFRWVVLVDPELPDDIGRRLQGLLRPFGGRAQLCRCRHRIPEILVGIAKDRMLPGQDRYLLTGRLDDDDAWSTRMVAAVRGRAAKWIAGRDRSPGLSFTFQDGLEWVMCEMVDVEKLLDHKERVVHAPAIRRYSQPFVGMSVFVCSELSAGGTAMAGSHSLVADQLRARKGFETDILDSESPMWLYCRHKQAGSGIQKAQGAEVQLTLEDLAARFGLDRGNVRDYLDHSDSYRYLMDKDSFTKRRRISRECLRLSRELEGPTVSAAERSDLERRRGQLGEQMARLEVEFLGDPEEIEATR